VKTRYWVFGSAALAGMVGLWICHDAALTRIGRSLILEDPLPDSTYDVVVLPIADDLAIDSSMESLQAAARLVRAGRARRLVMSCPDWYGRTACSVAQSALDAGGMTEIRVEPIRQGPLPDEVEARKVVDYLAGSGTTSAIAFLPNYKTRRLGSLYKSLGNGARIVFAVRPSSSPFDPQKWWLSGASWKLVVYEMVRRLNIV